MFCALSMAATMLTGCGQPAAEMPEAQEQEQTATTEPETVETPEEPETPEPFAETDSVPIRVAALKGPTAMGMVQMMDASDKGELEGCDYTFSIEASADLVTPLLAKGEMDLAAVPANLASVLYNNMDGGVEVLPSIRWAFSIWWRVVIPFPTSRTCGARPSMPAARTTRRNMPSTMSWNRTELTPLPM